MGFRAAFPSLKPREPRISVCVPARLRIGAQWTDACILNVSSRGLLIHSADPAERGTYVELRRADQVIVARVIWRSGSLAGLRAQDRVPVEAIATSRSRGEPRTQPATSFVERRSVPRDHDRSRMRGRALEFASAGIIAATLSVAVLSIVSQALAQPFAKVSTALAGQASLPADSR